MLVRLESNPGPVWKWLTSNNNALYDNSIEGVHSLSLKAINTSAHIYYFSLSFHATVPFPEDWPAWGRDAIASFPTNIEDFMRAALENLPIPGLLRWVIQLVIDRFITLGWIVITNVTSFRSFVSWVTDAVITRILHELSYNLVLPMPGKYIPRQDVIPIMLLSVYSMGGQDLTPVQRGLLGPNLGDWYQNDGIVNTESMRGPDEAFVRSISSLPDFNFNSPGKRGTYWHFGINDQMDHADEIGVFIEQNTVRPRIRCYLELCANLRAGKPYARDVYQYCKSCITTAIYLSCQDMSCSFFFFFGGSYTVLNGESGSKSTFLFRHR
jgi:hypothetical protein